MLTGLLGLVKALGAPLPLWVVVLPALIDLVLGVVMILFVCLAMLFFYVADKDSYRFK